MSLAQVSLEVEQQGPHGQWRRRLSVTLDCDDSEKLERHSPPHLTASSPDTLAAITSPNGTVMFSLGLEGYGCSIVRFFDVMRRSLLGSEGFCSGNLLLDIVSIVLDRARSAISWTMR